MPQSRPTSPAQDPLDLSVVVPTYNRADILRRTLPALLAQDMGPYRAEILVADDGSQDDTAQAVASLAGQDNPSLRHLPLEHGGKSRALNQGASQARSELVLLLDCDILPGPRVLQGHIELHRQLNDRRCVLGGNISMDLGQSMLDAVFVGKAAAPGQGLRRWDSWMGFPQAHASLHQSFLMEMGLFDEYLDAYEDLCINRKLALAGARFWLAPSLDGLHLCPTMGGDSFLGRAPRYGRALALWERKSPGVLDDLQNLGRGAADYGLPVINDNLWQVLKDRLDRRLVNSLTYDPLLFAARAAEYRCRPLAVRLFRRLYRYRLRQAFLEAQKTGAAAQTKPPAQPIQPARSEGTT